MGRRKFRCVVRKNEERKKYAVTSLVVSINLSEGIALAVTKESLALIVSLPLSALTDSPAPNVPALQSRLAATGKLPLTWIQPNPSIFPTRIVLCQLSYQPNPELLFSLAINEDFQWTLSVASSTVPQQSCHALSSIASTVRSVAEVIELLRMVESSKICTGNSDDKFMEVAKRRDGIFKDKSGTKTVAYLDSRILPYPTVRHSDCELLVSADRPTTRCHRCSENRSTLHVQHHRLSILSSSRLDPSSHATYASLSNAEKDERLRNLHGLARQNQKQIERLKAKLAAVTESQGVDVDEVIQTDLHSIMSNESNSVLQAFPEGSFARVFWQQQLDAASRPDKRGMRWHPLMVKWCLYLRHKSSGAYELLRSSGCLTLPSQRTLRDYTHYVKATVGFSGDVDRQLARAAKLESCQDFQKCVLILIDEMHVKEDLVYDKHTGALIGFANLGDINTHLLTFEHSISQSTSSEPPLASTMMTFMVQGLFTPLSFPYVQFPCSKVTGELLFSPFWEAVYRLERMQLKVLGVTFDGASVNRRLIKIHRPKEELVYKVPNPYASDSRELLFISDPPHLIKTTRNCWVSKARNLWNNGKSISWQHLTSLYERDRLQSGGLSLVPKLRFEHVCLNSFAKMRVDLAAQVLSETVSKALGLTGGAEAKETAHFVSIFDKFFDCLNVGNFTSGRNSRKVFRQPYRSSQDFRLKWLESEFLPYLDDWEKSVEKRQGFKKSLKNRMLLSQETRLGLRITTHSFIDLVRYVFTLPGVKVFLSQKICQDPLEKFFGCQRQRGGTHENPTVADFCKNTQALRVINSFCRASVHGNCRGNKGLHTVPDDSENQPLPKRRRSQHK